MVEHPHPARRLVAFNAAFNARVTQDMLEELMEFYSRHIWKEDYLAFPMSDKVLSDEVKTSVTERYQVVDDRLGPGAGADGATP